MTLRSGSWPNTNSCGQTVENACGAIAMMNILMNAPSVRLGEPLREFKETTRAMSSPLRGHAISTNKPIREAHNSFTRYEQSSPHPMAVLTFLACKGALTTSTPTYVSATRQKGPPSEQSK